MASFVGYRRSGISPALLKKEESYFRALCCQAMNTIQEDVRYASPSFVVSVSRLTSRSVARAVCGAGPMSVGRLGPI